jgi:hypothetical protein
MRAFHLATAAFACMALAASAAAASTNLLADGSFEDEDFTGWTTGGNFEFSYITGSTWYVYTGPEDGSFYAVLGPVGSDGTLSQTFSDTAGQGLVVSFWLDAVGDDPSDFSATFDGTTTLYSASDPSTDGVWQQFTFDVTGTGSDTLQFAFRDDSAYIALDNVSVAGVPEPAAWALLLTGFAGVGLALRRRTRLLRA